MSVFLKCQCSIRLCGLMECGPRQPPTVSPLFLRKPPPNHDGGMLSQLFCPVPEMLSTVNRQLQTNVL